MEYLKVAGMIRRNLMPVAVCALLIGCSGSEPEPAAVAQRQVFKHADFEFLMLENWDFLKEESQRDRVMFQSSVTTSGLTISIMQWEQPPVGEEARTAFERIVSHRRQAEKEINPARNMTEYIIVEGNGRLYSKWGGTDLSSEQRTATLVTFEKGKAYTLFVETYGTSNEFLNQIADEIFRSFIAK